MALLKKFVSNLGGGQQNSSEDGHPDGDHSQNRGSQGYGLFGNSNTDLDDSAVKEFAAHMEDDTYTVEQAVEAFGFGKFQWKLTFVCGLCWLADAMEMMILSVLGPEVYCEWMISTTEEALITTVVFGGMLISSSMWGSICDRFGRKLGLLAASFWVGYYGILSSFAPGYFWLISLRFLVGFGIGGIPHAVTIYAEFLPSAHRARCVVLFEFFWAIGTFVAILISVLVVPVYGWRMLLFVCAFPSFIFCICCLWLPESARFHVLTGQPEKAQATLKRIAMDNNKPMPLGTIVVNKNAKRGRILDLFSSNIRTTTIILSFLWFISTFTYYGVILLTTEIFEGLTACSASSETTSCYAECTGLSTEDYIDTLWTTCAEFPGLIFSFLIIEPLGRKKTMSVQFFLYAVFCGLLCICTSRTMIVVFLFGARAMCVGAFQTLYAYTPEVYPTSIRAIGIGTLSGISRLGAMITPFVAQVLLPVSYYGTMSLYGGLAFVGAVVSMLLPIETRGRSMADASPDDFAH